MRDYSEAKRRQMVETKAIVRTAANIENAYFRDFVKTEEILFDPEGTYEPDRDWLETGREMGFYTAETGNPFVLRYELSLRKLIEKEEVLRVEQIADKLETYLAGEYKTKFEVSYYTGIGPQVVRVRARDLNIVKSTEDAESAKNAESAYRQLAGELEGLHISGLEAVKKVFQDNSTPFIHFGFDARFTPRDLADPRFGGIFRKDLTVKASSGSGSEEAVKELIIMTEGSDLLSVLGMPDVDATRTVVNDLPEVYATLGAEAARAMMVAEMAKTLPDAGLNPRHYPLLADVMMARPTGGRMVAINRNGMRDTNTGVLAQASFEQPGDAFLKAAAYALRDNAQTVSSAVALGTEMRQGTGSFGLLLDTGALPELPDEANDLRLVRPEVGEKAEVDASAKSVAVSAVGGMSAVTIFTNSVGSQLSASRSLSTAASTSGMSQVTGGSRASATLLSGQSSARSSSARSSVVSRATSSVMSRSNGSRVSAGS